MTRTRLSLNVLDREKMASFLASFNFQKLVKFQNTALATQVSLKWWQLIEKYRASIENTYLATLSEDRLQNAVEILAEET